MKVITYKQLCKEQSGTMFATLNKMNEMGEIFVIGRYADDRKYLYSPLADVTNPATNEIEFDSNCFNRRDGVFVAFTQEEIHAYVQKLFALLPMATRQYLDQLKAAVDAQAIADSVAQTQAIVKEAVGA